VQANPILKFVGKVIQTHHPNIEERCWLAKKIFGRRAGVSQRNQRKKES
jgi:hypothetical protein